MTDVRHPPRFDQDETLSKLETALKDASGIDMRAAIESAIKERKAELRKKAD